MFLLLIFLHSFKVKRFAGDGSEELLFAVTLAKKGEAGHSFQMQHAKQLFSFYKTAAPSVQFRFFPPLTVGIERLATPR